MVKQVLSVMMITGKGLVLNDDLRDTMESINSLRTIIQFIIDWPLANYSTNLVYLVSQLR